MENNRYEVPISVKGIVWEDGRVWLRMNERKEWELPGGRLHKGEQPEDTLKREIHEELGVRIEPGRLVQTFLYDVPMPGGVTSGVFVVSFVGKIIEKVGGKEHFGEAGFAKFKKFSLDDIDALPMPQFYKDAIHVSVQD